MLNLLNLFDYLGGLKLVSEVSLREGVMILPSEEGNYFEISGERESVEGMREKFRESYYGLITLANLTIQKSDELRKENMRAEQYSLKEKFRKELIKLKSNLSKD